MFWENYYSLKTVVPESKFPTFSVYHSLELTLQIQLI